MTTKINPQFLKSIHTEINDALKTIAEKHNVHMVTGNGSYEVDQTSGHLKLEINQIAANGEVITDEVKNLRRYHPDTENRTVVLGGVTHKVVGYSTRARKNPFIIKDPRGKKYTARYEVVMSQMDKMMT
ncbi:HAD hydrolase family protein [Roseibium sp. RKSG952]|uniref:HAD hydrolase family protein n=1 Tax=Roseibium sp. RKSG952 TaxID=2529384 RepID=UPI0012BB4955|nr:HAD hydrolase family protein [Roseibium sp. RKSG952]MTH95044.1 hypothetical protein [Roseibium sp. RKSG952]